MEKKKKQHGVVTQTKKALKVDNDNLERFEAYRVKEEAATGKKVFFGTIYNAALDKYLTQLGFPGKRKIN